MRLARVFAQEALGACPLTGGHALARPLLARLRSSLNDAARSGVEDVGPSSSERQGVGQRLGGVYIATGKQTGNTRARIPRATTRASILICLGEIIS